MYHFSREQIRKLIVFFIEFKKSRYLKRRYRNNQLKNWRILKAKEKASVAGNIDFPQ